MRFHLRPLGVSQHKSFHPKLESQTSSTWNPKSQQALEQIRVGWNRRRRSTDPVNRLYHFEVDRIHVGSWNRGAGSSDHDPIQESGQGRSEEDTSENQYLKRNSYARLCLKKKQNNQ